MYRWEWVWPSWFSSVHKSFLKPFSHISHIPVSSFPGVSVYLLLVLTAFPWPKMLRPIFLPLSTFTESSPDLEMLQAKQNQCQPLCPSLRQLPARLKPKTTVFCLIVRHLLLLMVLATRTWCSGCFFHGSWHSWGWRKVDRRSETSRCSSHSETIRFSS